MAYTESASEIIPAANSEKSSSGSATSSATVLRAKSEAQKAETPQLSSYTDFRQFLKDVYAHRREHESTGIRSYSYSAFSAAADIKSPNYLKLIIEGRRNLSDDMIVRFARALRLQKFEMDEFHALVHYGQATEPIERNQYLKELADIRARRAFATGELSPQAWEKIPSWMGWVLYAMTDQKNVSFEADELYRLMRAKTSPEDVRGEMKRLVANGDLKQAVSDTGAIRYSKGRDLIDAPQELPVEMIRKLQAELIYLGIESLFRDSPKEREFGAMTIAMTQSEFEQVRFELRQTRKRIQKDLKMNREAGQGERVYQMNIQLFPVTDKVDGGQA
ncbi:hypothetical protein BH10BDE1_BH10BDE1_17130 [soil metagenome]